MALLLSRAAALVDDGDDALVVMVDAELAVVVTVKLLMPSEGNFEKLLH